MAQFSTDGLDGLMLSMQEIAEIPPYVQEEMLHAQADVVEAAQKRKIRDYGIYSTGKTLASVKKGKIKLRKGQRVIYISPVGSRRRGNTVTRNAEVLFVNEFGKKGQKARPAIRDANEACAAETMAAGLTVYDAWLKSKNL